MNGVSDKNFRRLFDSSAMDRGQGIAHAGAGRAGATWVQDLGLARPITFNCMHSHVSRQPSRPMRGEPGAWFVGDGVTAEKRTRPSLWVTRERPKIDRIACPWLIRRFIDADAQFFYVPANDVLEVARETGAVPYDIPGAILTHRGERCSFDAFMEDYRLVDSALLQLADIVRGADTGRMDLAPQAAGLFAISIGLSANIQDDHAMLRYGLVIYDALYASLTTARDETHNCAPATDNNNLSRRRAVPHVANKSDKATASASSKPTASRTFPSNKFRRSGIAKLLALVLSAYRWAMDEIAIRRSIRELEQLDDLTLKDIGIERFDIESFVRKEIMARR